MLVIAAAVAASVMMASPVMADDFKIGICNYVDDASLNQIVDNIQSRLEELGEEKGVTFDVSYDNCNADASVMEQIISDFQADNVDLMVVLMNCSNFLINRFVLLLSGILFCLYMMPDMPISIIQ